MRVRAIAESATTVKAAHEAAIPGAGSIAIQLAKALSAYWEYMFGRALCRTAGMGGQHTLLDEVVVDAGRIARILGVRLAPICAGTLRQAHAGVESGTLRGKIVIEGWD